MRGWVRLLPGPLSHVCNAGVESPAGFVIHRFIPFAQNPGEQRNV